MWHKKNDDALAADVRDELFWDPSIDASNVTVSASNGVATLSGTVPSYAMKLAAARKAERVSGVRMVVQHLNVQLPDAHSRSDADLAKAAATALKWDIEVPDDKIKAQVENGIITLEGEVEWEYQRFAAERAVRTLVGVVRVENAITLRPTVQASDVRERIKKALERSAETEATNITVETSDGTVTLRGMVHSWAERQDARLAAWAAPGVRSVDDRLMIA